MVGIDLVQISDFQKQFSADGMLEKVFTNHELLENKKIEKWDGKLPQVSGQATPFINLK